MPVVTDHATTVLEGMPHVDAGAPVAGREPAAPDAWVRAALHEGIRHAREHAGPLPAMLLADGCAAEYLFDGDGRSHPLELALRALLAGAAAAGAPRLALVMGTRTTTPAGRQSDAVLVLACERDRPSGEVWAQAWRPARWYRPFATDGLPWRIGAAPNLYREAAQHPLSGGSPA